MKIKVLSKNKKLLLKPRRFLNPNVFYNNILNKSLYNKDIILHNVNDYDEYQKNLSIESYSGVYSLFKPMSDVEIDKETNNKSELKLNSFKSFSNFNKTLAGTFVDSNLSRFKFLNFEHQFSFELMTPGKSLAVKQILSPFNKLLFYLNKFSKKLQKFKASVLLLKPSRSGFLCLYNGIQGYIPSKHLRRVFIYLKDSLKVTGLKFKALDLINRKVLYRIPLLFIKVMFNPVSLEKNKSRRGKYRIQGFEPNMLELTFLLVNKLDKKCLKFQKSIF